MKIPVDSITVEHIKDTWLDKFKDKVRKLRLSKDMDGVNLYSLQNINYSVWPVVVINNNIPPWLSKKNENLMLAFIVLGRRHVKNMEVYLQPLIDEFKQLWERIHVYVYTCIKIHSNREVFYVVWHMAYMAHKYSGLGVCSGKHVHWFFVL